VLHLLSAVLLSQNMSPVSSDTDPPKTIQMLAMDLSNGGFSERRFAGRELHRKARASDRHLQRAASDSLEALEARKTQAELRRYAMPACMTQLTEQATALFCAQLLENLGDPSALPTVQAALESQDVPRRARRALRRTESMLQEHP
jgi:hypothetical protein